MVRTFLALLILVVFSVGCGTMTVIKEPTFIDKSDGKKKQNVNVHSTNTNFVAPSTDTNRGYVCDATEASTEAIDVITGGDPGHLGECTVTKKPFDHAGKGALEAASGVTTAAGLAYGLGAMNGDDTQISNGSNSGSSAFSGSKSSSRSHSSSRARSSSRSRSGGMMGPMD
jgi:hypothetical protein